MAEVVLVSAGYVALFAVAFCLVGLGLSSFRWARYVNDGFEGIEYSAHSTVRQRLRHRKRLRYYKQMRTYTWGALLSITASLLYVWYGR